MSAKELFQQAREAHSIQDLEKAKQLYERVISEYSTSEEADLSRAYLYNIQHPTESTSESPDETASVAGVAQGVVITDIQMPFWSMVAFMVKWVIATVPALIILFIIVSALTGVSTGILGGLLR